MFGLFKKREGEPKVDAAEIERREREERKRELARQMQEQLQADKKAEK